MENYLVMKDITKVYDNGVIANDKVNFSARKGEIHAICGENGAGKTTLMKMLFGIEKPDEGQIIIKGNEVNLTSPTKAIEAGIGMVHQHFMLVPSLTVAENVILGIEPTKGLKFDMEKAIEMTQDCCKKYGFDINPRARVQDLTVGVKQKVEIVKALVKGCEILILDEPTAVLTPQETTELFVQLKHLRESGHTIIFISHKLNEVKELCDRVTVIRKGRTIGLYNIEEVTEADISKAMVGIDVDLVIPKEKAQPKDNVLVVKDLGIYNAIGKKVVKNVSFSVREGEIVGIAGVEGNGQRELIDAITGLHVYSEGSIELLGQEVGKKNIKGLREQGLVHVPEDRMTLGVAGSSSIKENMVADKIDKDQFSSKLLTKQEAIKLQTDKWIEEYLVLCKSGEQEVSGLSGGNIQKVVVAREFSSYNKLIVCDQPTRGIDVGASEFIRRRMIQMRDEGKAILLISADLGEIMNLSDSLIVMYGGEIGAYFPDITDLSEEELGYYMLGVKKMTPEQIGGALHE
ncbi:MAG: ABC transporter ATP-binding protein [Bacillota bacterium]|jgi:simple sugar transport system ATP-binding protein|nr:ABC transporter ATP-binding protein [Bacillota bacterium]NLL25935.1 ABC transporter ATP-binding protein [Erysipelotrichia bacterium]